jgi:hypothetical protein
MRPPTTRQVLAVARPRKSPPLEAFLVVAFTGTIRRLTRFEPPVPALPDPRSRRVMIVAEVATDGPLGSLEMSLDGCGGASGESADADRERQLRASPRISRPLPRSRATTATDRRRARHARQSTRSRDHGVLTGRFRLLGPR